jgi:DNA-binding MarR family transcriptional regulator
MYAVIREAGFDDVPPTHALLFRYPTIADLRPSQLAEQAGMSKQGVNDLLRQLEANGYLTLRPDPTDGRARLITLTERGAALMDTTRKAAQQVADEWASGLGREPFEAFERTLRDLTAADGARPVGSAARQTGGVRIASTGQ